MKLRPEWSQRLLRKGVLVQETYELFAAWDDGLSDVQNLKSTLVGKYGTAGWERGTEAEYLAELVRSWADEYDWRPHEQRIRALPLGPRRVVHQRAEAGPSLRRDSTASHRQFRAVSAGPACEPSPPVRL